MAVFVLLLGKGNDPAIGDDARDKATRRLDFVEQHLAGHDDLLDRFTSQQEGRMR